jgi:hypothetical protein
MKRYSELSKREQKKAIDQEMTDSKTYQVAGADVIITCNVYVGTIDVHITLDLSPLDREEPDHSPHQIIHYMSLPHYTTRQSYWWCKLYHDTKCKTASQARRIIKWHLDKIDDAVSQAIIARNTRKAEGTSIFSGITR